MFGYREVTDASSLLIAARSSDAYSSSPAEVSSPMASSTGRSGHRMRMQTGTGTTTGVPSIQEPESWRDVNEQDALEEHYGQQHEPVGFWHEHLSKVRMHVFLLWARTVWIILCFLMAVLSLYWGTLFEADGKVRGMTVHIVDFDGQVAPYEGGEALVGPALTEMAETQVGTLRQKSLGYVVVPPSDFNNSPTAVRQSVYDFDAWAAIVIHANATAQLQNAVLYGNASYDPTGAVHIITLSARDDFAYANYVLPQLRAFAAQFTASFGRLWAESLLTNTSVNSNVLARAPAAVNPAVSPLFIDLRPFGPPTVVPSVSSGLMYLMIVSFFSFNFFLPIHNKFINPQGHPPLKFRQLIVWRWCATVMSYLLISLVYTLVPLAFQIPLWTPPASPVKVAINATAYGQASFLVLWALNFLAMCALGLACENVALIVGQPWSALWLVFWVVTNTATAFYNFDLAPSFYKWGYAWPLYNVVEATRHILFDLHSRIGINFAVLLVWTVVNTALFAPCCYFMRWRAERDEMYAESESDRYVVETYSPQGGAVKETPQQQQQQQQQPSSATPASTGSRRSRWGAGRAT